MRLDAAFSKKLVGDFRDAKAKHKLSVVEYLVWHALIATCMDIGDVNIAQTTSVAAICDLSQLSRETVRRTLYVLADKGLAKRTNEMWIFIAA